MRQPESNTSFAHNKSSAQSTAGMGMALSADRRRQQETSSNSHRHRRSSGGNDQKSLPASRAARASPDDGRWRSFIASTGPAASRGTWRE